jgi:hypothetical protein
MSVRLHYPEVFDGSSGINKIDNLDDQTEGFNDFEQRLDLDVQDGRVCGTRDILQSGRLRLSNKFPLDNSTTSDKTQAASLLIISLRSRRQRKLSICLEE